VPLLIVAFTLFVILAAIALTPLALVQRYRLGTARRRARGWSATVNVAGLAFSSALFLAGAGITSLWVPNALTLSLIGFASGCLLGRVGLALSRWEPAPESLHYTPNRWLVLGITLLVTARLAFGFWRSWQAWHATADYGSWVAESGVAGSLAAGAVVLGYYLTYWLGVRRRLRRHSEGRARSSYYGWVCEEHTDKPRPHDSV
jgi:hypothetical protein